MDRLQFPVRYYRLYPPEKFLGHAEEVIDLAVATTAFLVVDVYGPGFSPEDEAAPPAYPSMSLAEAAEVERDIVVNHIRPAIDAARRAGLPIIYVNNSAPRIEIGRSELGKITKRVNDLDWDEWGAEDNIDPREYVYGPSTAVKFSRVVEPQPTDYFIRKHANSGFFETRLDGLLRNLGVKTLICVGFALDLCLGATMEDAKNLNYQIVLLRDCTLALELPHELPGLDFTRRMILRVEYSFGYTATSEAFITAAG